MSVPYAGTKIYFASQDWVVPSLSVAQFQDYYETLTASSELTGFEAIKARFDAFIPIIGAALRRNYPDVKDTDLHEQLDLRTFNLCLKAVQNASGLVEATPGEA